VNNAEKAPPALPVPRYVWMAGLTVLIATLVLTGIVIALSPKEKAARIVYGMGAVYKAGLVHPVDETQQVGDISLTVDWVYADWNQILVGYTALGRADEDTHVSAGVVSARLPDGTTLEGGVTTGYGEMGADSSVAAFDMPEVMRDRQTIDLLPVLRAAYEQYPNPTRTDPTEVAQQQSTTGVSTI
jgi:hypothetical protein